MNRCLGTKRDNSPCTVTVEPPQRYCWWHDPANAEQRKLAASKGGRRAGRGRPLAEITEAKRHLKEVIDGVLEGAIHTSKGNTTAALYNTLLRCYEVELSIREQTELLPRMEELEKLLDNKEVSRWGA